MIICGNTNTTRSDVKTSELVRMCLAQPGYGSGLLFLRFTVVQINVLLNSISVVVCLSNAFLRLKYNFQAIFLEFKLKFSVSTSN